MYSGTFPPGFFVHHPADDKLLLSGGLNGIRFVHFVGNGLRAVPSAQRLQPNGPERPDEWNAVWTDVIPFNEL